MVFRSSQYKCEHFHKCSNYVNIMDYPSWRRQSIIDNSRAFPVLCAVCEEKRQRLLFIKEKAKNNRSLDEYEEA